LGVFVVLAGFCGGGDAGGREWCVVSVGLLLCLWELSGRQLGWVRGLEVEVEECKGKRRVRGGKEGTKEDVSAKRREPSAQLRAGLVRRFFPPPTPETRGACGCGDRAAGIMEIRPTPWFIGASKIRKYTQTSDRNEGMGPVSQPIPKSHNPDLKPPNPLQYQKLMQDTLETYREAKSTLVHFGRLPLTDHFMFSGSRD